MCARGLRVSFSTGRVSCCIENTENYVLSHFRKTNASIDCFGNDDEFMCRDCVFTSLKRRKVKLKLIYLISQAIMRFNGMKIKKARELVHLEIDE